MHVESHRKHIRWVQKEVLLSQATGSIPLQKHCTFGYKNINNNVHSWVLADKNVIKVCNRKYFLDENVANIE